MRIKLDATVRTSDGHAAGRAKRAIFDPAANEVSGFVIDTGGLFGHEVVVSRDVLERAGVDGDDLIVDLSKDELRGLERYEQDDFAAAPVGWMPPALYDYPAGMYLFPVQAETSSAQDAARPARPSIAKEMTVRDATGRSIGVVKEVRIDDMTGELRSVLVKESDPAGRGTTIEIPAEQVDVGDGELRLVEDSGTAGAGREGISPSR